MKVVVYVLCYDDVSERVARDAFPYPWARPLRIPESTVYMEGKAFADLLPALRHEWEDADYVGTLSYRAHSKIEVPLDLEAVCERSGADVVALAPLTCNMLEQATVAHPRFLELWVPVLGALGFSEEQATHPDVPAFLCNYWVARPAWVLRYLDFYARAVRVLETRPDIQDVLWSDPGYVTKLPKDTLLRIYGKPYITYHPFVCERLACFFFWEQGAAVHLQWCTLYCSPTLEKKVARGRKGRWAESPVQLGAT